MEMLPFLFTKKAKTLHPVEHLFRFFVRVHKNEEKMYDSMNIYFYHLYTIKQE